MCRHISHEGDFRQLINVGRSSGTPQKHVVTQHIGSLAPHCSTRNFVQFASYEHTFRVTLIKRLGARENQPSTFSPHVPLLKSTAKEPKCAPDLATLRSPTAH